MGAGAVRLKYKYSDRKLVVWVPTTIAGRFCSYCERKIASGIAVEHKRPKKKYPLYELEWDNSYFHALIVILPNSIEA
jgi:hypothetical protein